MHMNVGMVGIGTMGAGIVQRLLAAGHVVTGWNRTEGKAAGLVSAGMAWADSPRDVARASEVVFSIVTDAAAVRAVALGDDGIVAGLSADGIYLTMSTIDPAESRAVAAAFAEAGLTMLDAPLSGSPVTLEQGKASIMVGGDRDAFERVEHVLLDIGARASYIGANGTAAQMKLSINLVLMVEVIAFGEGIRWPRRGASIGRSPSTRC